MVKSNRRDVKRAVPLSGRGEERGPGRNRCRDSLTFSSGITHRCRRQEMSGSGADKVNVMGRIVADRGREGNVSLQHRIEGG